MNTTTSAMLLGVLTALLPPIASAGAQGRALVDAGAVAEARQAIAEGNRKWGAARVAYDRATFERMLAPDFYAQFPDRRVERAAFIEQISSGMPGATLRRFDATVLTVQPAPGGQWTAVIQEKLEITRQDASGNPVLTYALWITRDGWRKAGDQWQITSSEVIGVQMWRGSPPPIENW